MFFAETFNRTIRDLPERPVSEKGDGNSIDILLTITKQCNNRVHTSTKLSPKDPSSKNMKSFVYKNLLDKRKKVKANYKVGDLVGTADLKKTFSKSDTTNWSYKMYKITENVNDKT